MNWTQYLNDIISWGLETAAAILLFMVSVLFLDRFFRRVIWDIGFYRITGMRRRTLKYLEDLSTTNLKPTYQFFDHAIDEYNLSSSYLEYDASCNYLIPRDTAGDKNELWRKKLTGNLKKVLLKTDYNLDEILTRISREIAPSDDDCVKRIGVCYFSHNRSQRSEEDEAHWFRIEFYVTDTYTHRFLSAFAKEIQPACQTINQPRMANLIYPLILGVSVSADVYFKYRDEYYLLVAHESGWLDNLIKTDLEYEDIMEWEKEYTEDYYQCTSPRQELSVNGLYLEAKLENLYKDLYDHRIIRIRYTDIGLDQPSHVLRIFATILIHTPAESEIRSWLATRQCYKIDAFNRSDIQNKLSLRLKYSWINLQTRMKK